MSRIWDIEIKLRGIHDRIGALKQRLTALEQRSRNTLTDPSQGDGLFPDGSGSSTVIFTVLGCNGYPLQDMLIEVGVGYYPLTYPYQGLTDGDGKVTMDLVPQSCTYRIQQIDGYRASRAYFDTGIPTRKIQLIASSGYVGGLGVSLSGGDRTGATIGTVYTDGASYYYGSWITGITLSSGGSGYSTPPDVVITGDGYGASADCIINGVKGTSITNAGYGYGSFYTKVPITVTGGSPTRPAVMYGVPYDGPNCSDGVQPACGSISGISMTDVGEGYTSAPTLTFPSVMGAGGATAICSVGLGGEITHIRVTNQVDSYRCFTDCGPPFRIGYLNDAFGSHRTKPNGCVVTASGMVSPCTGGSSPPTPYSGQYNFTYLFAGDAATSSIAAGVVTTSGGVVTGVTLTRGGFGYKNPPTVTVNTGGGGGSGAVITAVLTGDTVTGLNLISGGSGYTYVPGLVFSLPEIFTPKLYIKGWDCNSSAGYLPIPASGPVTGNDISSEGVCTGWSCYPYSITYDFTGTSVDGVFFQGSTSKIVTLTT